MPSASVNGTFLDFNSSHLWWTTRRKLRSWTHINPKLQRLKERLSPYVFKTVWRKGREHAIPDALSRTPVNAPSAEDEAANADVQSFARRVSVRHVQAVTYSDTPDQDEETGGEHLADPIILNRKEAAVADGHYQELLAAIESGFPQPRQLLAHHVKQFWKIRYHFSVDDEFLQGLNSKSSARMWALPGADGFWSPSTFHYPRSPFICC